MSIRAIMGGQVDKCRTIDKVQIFPEHGDVSSVAGYDFEGNANDVLGSYNGTATNVTYGTGKYGQGAVFNGTSSKITTSTTLGINTFTYSLWVNPTSVPINVMVMLSFVTGNASLISGNDTNNYVYYYDGAYKSFNNYVLPSATWTHLVLVVNNTTATLYADGVSKGTVAVTAISPTGGMNIGVNLLGTGGYWNGSLDQVRIFNKALTAWEVNYLYTTDLSGKQQMPWDGCSVAAYDFENNANDLLGTYNGTATNVTYSAGKYGQGAVFNGSATVSTTRSIVNLTTAFSNSYWIKATSSNHGKTQVIYSNDTAGSTCIQTLTNASGVIRLLANNATTATLDITGTKQINDNVWHHIVLTNDGTTKKVYVDGVLDITTTSGTATATMNLWVGGVSGALAYATVGTIDQLRIFNRALTATEVSYLYNTDVSGIAQMPWTTKSGVALYRLDGNANDESGNYHGTETAITYGGGVYERGAVFNGSSSFISTTNLYLLLGDSFSISGWVSLATLGAYRGITSCASLAADGGHAFAIDSANKIVLQIMNGSTTLVVTGATSLTANTLVHVVATYDKATTTGKVYFNATLDATNTSIGSIKAPTKQVVIGKGDPSATAWMMNGTLDQVRIFNRALTATEVATLYAECAPTSTVDNINPFEDGSLKALYQFNGDATDKTGVYNGTATNVTYGTGKFGNCAVFNGNTVVTSLAPVKTISMFVKADMSTFTDGFIFETRHVGGTAYVYIDNADRFQFAGGTCSINGIPLSSGSTYQHSTKWAFIVFTLTASVTGFKLGQEVSGGYYINGTSIDQVRIFNKALTPMEVASLYNETTPLEEPMHSLVDPFKDGSGKALYRLDGNALDESGNYNGTATSVTYGAGRFGRAGVFNGTSSKIAVSAISGATTISFWTNKAITNGTAKVVASNSNDTAIFIGESFAEGTSETISMYSYTGSVTRIAYIRDVINDTTWKHIVIQYISSGVYEIYVNGTLRTIYYGGGVIDNKINTFTQYGTYSTGSAWLDASIDQVRIFNRALTASEVQTLYTEV